MSQEMQKVADQLREDSRQKEKYLGTGFHDNDRNPTKPDIFVAQQRKLIENSPDKFFCKASENVVAFTGEFDVVFVGEDAEKVLKCCRQWAESLEDYREEDITEKQRKFKRYISKMEVTTKDGEVRLTLRKALWNDYAHILYSQGQGIFGQPLPFSEE